MGKRLFDLNIEEVLDKALAEDWTHLLKAARQPVQLLNALGAFGPPGTPPVPPREQAMDTLDLLSDGRYVEIPGNHMTMPYGEWARDIVEAVLALGSQ